MLTGMDKLPPIALHDKIEYEANIFILCQIKEWSVVPMLRNVTSPIRNMKLHTKLLLSYIFITLLPVMIISYFLVTKIVETAYTQTEINYDINTLQIKTNIVNQLKFFVTKSDSIIHEKELTDYIQNDDTETDYHQWILKYQRIYNNLSFKLPINDGTLEKLSIYTTNPTIVKDRRFIIELDKRTELEPWIKQISDAKGESVFLDPYRKVGDPYINDATLYISIGKLLNPFLRNKYINIAKYEIPETEIRKFIMDEGKNKKIFLLNDDNIVISSTEASYIGENAANVPVISQAMDTESNEEREKINTSESIIFLDRISSQDSLNGWKLITVISTETMNNNISSLVRYGVFICLVSITIAIIFIVLFSRTLTLRVQLLARNMSKISDGKFDVFVDTRGKDEIAELASSFKSMVERINNLINEVYLLDIKKKEAEINALQSQINPHFLFNTMESIRMNLWNKQDYETSEIIQKFAKLLRKSIEWGNDKVTLQREIELVEIYLKIQQYRYFEKLEYQIKIDESLNEYTIPKFTIQPIVENAIGHGIEMKKGKGMLRIFSEITEGKVIIVVQDDGIGIDEEKLELLKKSIYSSESESEGLRIGIRNVHQRLQLFYGENYGISISSKKCEGTRVEIAIPLLNA